MQKLGWFVLTLLMGSLFMACTTSRSHVSSPSYERNMARTSTDVAISKMEQGSADLDIADRKILFSAFLTLVVQSPDTASIQIEQIAKKYNGYVHEIGTNSTTIRIESEYLESSIHEISDLGDLRDKNITGLDVTEEYMDYEIRLENAEKSRERYLELLAKAENVEAALKVEKELERLNSTIDLLKGRMNRLNHLSKYSTITVRLKEEKKPGILGYVGLGLYHSVKWLFVRN